MKRILGILLVLSLVVPAFAVTGKVFTKFAGGGVDVGGTGFELNFDSFGVKYQLVPISNAINYVSLVWGGSDRNLDLYSPGYFELTGLKFGNVTVGFGLTPRITFLDNSTIETNNVTGVTNQVAQWKGNGYAVTFEPKVALNAGTINITTSDQTKFSFMSLSAREEGGASGGPGIFTNTHQVTFYEVQLGANMKYGVAGVSGEVGGYYKFGHMDKDIVKVLGNTNDNAYDWNGLNTWADALYKINDSFDFYAKLWFYMEGNKNVEVVNVTTNKNEQVSMTQFGPEAKVVYKIAGGQVKLNLGIGAVLVDKTTVDILSPTVTNIKSESALFLLGVRRDDNRSLLEFGGNSKFGNWEVGIKGRLHFALNITRTYKSSTTGGNTVVWARGLDSWAEQWGGDERLLTPVVRDVYLKYSLGMTEIKFNFAEVNDQGVFTAKGGLGTGTSQWFTSVDLSYKF